MNAAMHSMPAPSTSWWNHGLALRTRLFDGLSLMLPSAQQFLLDTLEAWQRSEQVSAEHKARWSADVAHFIRWTTRRPSMALNEIPSQRAPRMAAQGVRSGGTGE